MKKKVIIVNNNMNIGGVQKALVDFTKEIADKYDCTLYLFSKRGDYLDLLPKTIRIVESISLYRTLGLSYAESKYNCFWFVVRQIVALIFKLIGRYYGMRIINASQKKLKSEYDIAIAFFQNSGNNSFYGGCNDFVLNKINAEQKITFLHCDYRACGSHTPYNDRQYYMFDKIVACSEGCRNAFIEVLPALADKTFVVKNCHDYKFIQQSANTCKKYDSNKINIITVARMSMEKGIDRAIIAMKYVKEQGYDVCYHLVGGGPELNKLKKMVNLLGLSKEVIFYGNQSNPYPFIKGADLMLIPSYHEAAPLVVDEARCLGVPILSTKTTSSYDMIIETKSGWVCENSQEAINIALCSLLKQSEMIFEYKKMLLSSEFNNVDAITSFTKVVESRC